MFNKALLPRTKKYTTITGLDPFLIEALFKFKRVNLSDVIIEHIHKVMTAKDGKSGLAHGFWLSRVFAYFKVPCRPRKVWSVKKIFTVSTLEDNECIASQNGVKSKLVVANLIKVQTRL